MASAHGTVTFPPDPRGDEAMAILPDVIRMSHGKLCAAARAIEPGTPITSRVE